MPHADPPLSLQVFSVHPPTEAGAGGSVRCHTACGLVEFRFDAALWSSLRLGATMPMAAAQPERRTANPSGTVARRRTWRQRRVPDLDPAHPIEGAILSAMRVRFPVGKAGAAALRAHAKACGIKPARLDEFIIRYKRARGCQYRAITREEDRLRAGRLNACVATENAAGALLHFPAAPQRAGCSDARAAAGVGAPAAALALACHS
jgi:hypothetical protein